MDKNLFTAAKEGDVHAFEHIVFHFEQKIYRFIVTMVGPLQAEDLTQETFIKLYRNIDKYDDGKEFNAWVYTIARTTVYDWLRKERKRTDQYIIDDEESGYEPADTLSGNLLTIENVATKVDTREAIAKLPHHYREVLILYYWEEYTYIEIAEILEKPVNTIKTLLHRAKNKVKLLMEENDNELA